MALEFNPNNPAKQKDRPVWATYLPGRRGAKFKQHTDRGKALNALGYGHSVGILYHWKYDAGEGEYKWVEIARTDGPEATHCERCNVKFKSQKYPAPENDGTAYRYGVWIGKPELRYVHVCSDCQMDITHERYDPPKVQVYYVTDHKTGEKIPREQVWHWKSGRTKKVDQREL